MSRSRKEIEEYNKKHKDLFRFLAFMSIFVLPTVLLSTSCSILSNTNEIALKCEETVSLINPIKETVETKKLTKTYLINLKDKKVQLFTDTRITELFDVSIAPKSIYFREITSSDLGQDSILTEINRETLKMNVNGDNTNAGICKKIPYPPMVSSKNKI
jgi:hypothetical protein